VDLVGLTKSTGVQL